MTKKKCYRTYLSQLRLIHSHLLYPEIRTCVDLEFASSYPKVGFTYVICDPWTKFFQDTQYKHSKVFDTYDEARRTMLRHCKSLIYGTDNNKEL